MESYTSIESIIQDWKIKLATDPKWVEFGLRRIYEYQTRDEQRNKDVRNYNEEGFAPCDAYMLSSFAQQLNSRKGYHLSPRQLAYAYKRMPKYARQLVRQSIEKGIMVKVNGRYVNSKLVGKQEEKPVWTEADERRWIEYKNEFARLEAEQEQRAFESKMEYEMSLNRGR